jgi:hypothetical protein
MLSRPGHVPRVEKAAAEAKPKLEVVEPPRIRRREKEFKPGVEPKPAGPLDEIVAKARALREVKITVLTEEQKRALLLDLVKVFASDKSEERLGYNTKKAEVAERLGVTAMDVHRATMAMIEEEKEKQTGELTQAQKAIAITFGDKFELWIDPMDRAAHASIIVDQRCENYRIGDGAFEAWIRAEYGRRHWVEVEERRIPAVLNSTALHEGIATMRAMAQGRGKEISPALRVGGTTEDVWLDLGGPDWELVQVTGQGWRSVMEGVPSVRFVRKPGMLGLPRPLKGGKIRELREFLNVRDEDFVLDVGWQLGVLRPKGPYPLLIKTGVSGTAKTSGVSAHKRMTDPNFADLRPFKGEDDMYIGAYSSWIQAYDNISRVRSEEADLLCRISTGIGYAKRALRTDADQFLMRVCRPIILGGIPDDLAERGDLADRAIVQELPVLDEETQKFDDEFWEGFNAAHPRILGALLDGVSGAIRGYREISLSGYGRVRMGDFARWAEAGCRALGFEEDEFLTAYVRCQERAMRIALKQDLVARAVVLLIEQHPEGWRGNTKPLLKALNKAVGNAKQLDMLTQKAWPTNDVWLGRQLRRSAAVLRKAQGIEIEFDVDLRQTGEGDKDGLSITRRLGEYGE